MQIYGFIFFGVGLVLTTIGGFIAMVRNPSAFNNQSRSNFDPVRKDIPGDAIDSFGRAQWYDPKAKWWTRTGMPLAIGGMLLIYIESRPPSAENQPTKIDVTKPLVTGPRETK